MPDQRSRQKRRDDLDRDIAWTLDTGGLDIDELAYHPTQRAAPCPPFYYVPPQAQNPRVTPHAQVVPIDGPAEHPEMGALPVLRSIFQSLLDPPPRHQLRTAYDPVPENVMVGVDPATGSDGTAVGLWTREAVGLTERSILEVSRGYALGWESAHVADVSEALNPRAARAWLPPDQEPAPEAGPDPEGGEGECPVCELPSCRRPAIEPRNRQERRHPRCDEHPRERDSRRDHR